MTKQQARDIIEGRDPYSFSDAELLFALFDNASADELAAYHMTPAELDKLADEVTKC